MATGMKQYRTAAAALLVAGGIAACGDARATTAEDDFSRDLQLASTAVDLASLGVDSALLGALETKPLAAPEPAKKVARGSGTRAVRSRTPTVRTTPVVETAAFDESDASESLVLAATPEESMEPVAVAPRPTAPVIPAAGDYGRGSGGIYGDGGGRGGVVIRGGGVDGDNCELHRGGRSGTTTRGPIYIPRPVASTPTVQTAPTIGRGSSPRIGVGMGGARRAGSGTVGSVPTRTRPQSSPEARPATRNRSPRIGG